MSSKTIRSRFKPKVHFKKGDMVIVRSGDDKGKKARVLEINITKQMAFVEGVNIISKATKPDAKNPQGGIIKKEAAVHISKLALIDPKDGTATRIGRRIEDGKTVRFAKKSGEVIK
jgi:large subunit ribosomal protein L24